MTEPNPPDGDPATALFPQFESELHRMHSGEVAGLTDPQLDFESDRWEWSRWSIRRNLSHVCSGDYRWLVFRWGDQLFPAGLPDVGNLDSLVRSRYERRLDEDVYWELDAILGKLRESLGLCHQVLSGETVGSMRSKELLIDYDAQWRLFSKAHSTGLRHDPKDPSKVHISLEATMRHRTFEHTTHLYNIQRLKRAQGLTATMEVPEVGYWALPEWDRSEP